MPDPAETTFTLRDHERRITRIEDEGVSKVLIRIEERLSDMLRRVETIESTARALAEADARRQGGVGALKGIPLVLAAGASAAGIAVIVSQWGP